MFKVNNLILNHLTIWKRIWPFTVDLFGYNEDSINFFHIFQRTVKYDDHQIFLYFKYSSRPLNITSHMFLNMKWCIMWNFMFVPVFYLKPHGSQSFWLQHQHKWSQSMCFDNSSRPLNVTSHTFYNLKWWIMWDFMLVSNLSLKPHCSQSSPWLMSSSPDVWISSRKSNYMIPGCLEFICYCKVL